MATRRGLLRQTVTKVSADDLDGAIAVCKQNRGMLPRILEFGLSRGEKNRADITDALSIALMENLNMLERNLGIIGTTAVIAPFVGLFGTVLGIIRAFQDRSQGQLDAGRRRRGCFGSSDHDRRRIVRRRHFSYFLQLLQDPDQERTTKT